MEYLTPALLLRDGLPFHWAWFFAGNPLFAIISLIVGNTKGHGCLGFFLGLFFGPFGLLVTALLGSNKP